MRRTLVLLLLLVAAAALTLQSTATAATGPPARMVEILRLGPETVLVKIRCAPITREPGHQINNGGWTLHAGRRLVASGGYECGGDEAHWWPETWPGQLRSAEVFARAKQLTARLKNNGDNGLKPVAPPHAAPITGWSLYWKTEALGPEDGVQRGATDGNRAPGLWVSARSLSPKRCDWKIWLSGGATNRGSTDEDPTTTTVTFLVDGKVLLQAPMSVRVGEELFGTRLRKVLPRGRRILTVVARDAQGATTTQRLRLTCVGSQFYRPRR
jgi:hypothetical protein